MLAKMKFKIRINKKQIFKISKTFAFSSTATFEILKEIVGIIQTTAIKT